MITYLDFTLRVSVMCPLDCCTTWSTCTYLFFAPLVTLIPGESDTSMVAFLALWYDALQLVSVDSVYHMN